MVLLGVDVTGILLTGATGFIGRALLSELVSNDINIIASVRQTTPCIPENVKQYIISDLSEDTDWGRALRNIDVVIHTAARVHVMKEQTNNPLDQFRKVNTEATISLARQSAKAGVKRFIFLSSIKVNGEQTNKNQAFTAHDKFIPNDPYGLSKYEAEQGLLKLADETGMEVVIIRLPMVYGPGVKGNFQVLMKWVRKQWPLPFGAVDNQRSLLALDNAVSFIIHCLKHPKAANEVFLVSDDEDVSTTELLNKVAAAFELNIFLLPIPVSLMKFAAKMMGKGELASRLLGSLKIDISKAHQLLGWKPVITMDEQLKKIADDLRKSNNNAASVIS